MLSSDKKGILQREEKHQRIPIPSWSNLSKKWNKELDTYKLCSDEQEIKTKTWIYSKPAA